ncbi:MAG: T9SS type A sorting domain-containing protein, partial [Bacteroidia bacterium]
ILYQLKTTSDTVDLLPGNQAYLDKLGSGRVNLFRALSETNSPAIVLVEPEISDNADQLFLPGDTLILSGTFINYLSPANNVAVTIESLTDNLQVINPNRNLGSMESLETRDISNEPFQVLILEAVSFNEIARLRININADENIQHQTFPLKINASFINLRHNNVYASVGASGQIGPTGDQYLKGLGLRFQDAENLLFEGGLMMATDRFTVIDGIRGNTGNVNEWNATERFMRVAPFNQSTVQFRASMRSQEASAPIYVRQRVIADSLNPNRDFFIVEYEFFNESTIDFDSCYSGIFSDWDLGDYSKNKASYLSALKLSYTYEHQNDSVFAGVQVLGNSPAIAHAISNVSGGNGGLNLNDGFSVEEKYLSLSTSQPDAGIDGDGTDIITVTSSGPFSLPAGEQVRIAFAFHLSKSINQLFENASNARIFYNQVALPLSGDLISDKKSKLLVFPNPATELVYVSGGSESNLIYSLKDISGKSILNGNLQSQNKIINIPTHVKAGVYFLHLNDGYRNEVTKLVIASVKN